MLTNFDKGAILENTIISALRNIGANIKDHYTNREGLDIEGKLSKISIIGEAINWYGGYIHPNRMKSILSKLSKDSHIKFFFCCGVKPTKTQCRELSTKNIHLIHLPYQLLKYNSTDTLKLQHKILVVIYNTLVINNTLNVIYNTLKIEYPLMFKGLEEKKSVSRQIYFTKLLVEIASMDGNSRKNRKSMDKLLSRFCLEEGVTLKKTILYLDNVQSTILNLKQGTDTFILSISNR